VRFFCPCLASSSTSPPPPIAPRQPLSLSPLCRQVDGEWPSPVPLRRSLQSYSRIPRKARHSVLFSGGGPNFLGTQPIPPRPPSHVTQQRWPGQPAICSSPWACQTNVTGRCRQCRSGAQSRNPLPRQLRVTNLGRAGMAPGPASRCLHYIPPSLSSPSSLFFPHRRTLLLFLSQSPSQLF